MVGRLCPARTRPDDDPHCARRSTRAALHHAASIHFVGARAVSHPQRNPGVGSDHPQCAPGRRALRDPRGADPARARTGVRRARHHQAEHRQPWPLWFRGAGAPARGDRQPPARERRLRPRAGTGSGTRGDRRAATRPRRAARAARTHLHRQRGQRTDRPGLARPAAARRRGAAAEPGLPAVERGHHPQRRTAAVLPLPGQPRPSARPGRGGGAGQPAHPRAGAHQPQQSDRRGVPARAAAAPGRGRRAARPAAARR